ncbi:histidine phosphatase superfamily [Microdochium trichocladiopsis]|uniref:Histidine phosphatase superfamily n=1 Tax=Microdochium trichocladiopsis TaxID=1682393 RepID=A0A9P8XVQ8_9PEZI|nr:histidine phosphatase superfamily [Microdochium trichocladiopsis]KAH7021421.1 histidine phosphatase superfamily [Microdochium trichocladiopsis]
MEPLRLTPAARIGSPNHFQKPTAFHVEIAAVSSSSISQSWLRLSPVERDTPTTKQQPAGRPPQTNPDGQRAPISVDPKGTLERSQLEEYTTATTPTATTTTGAFPTNSEMPPQPPGNLLKLPTLLLPSEAGEASEADPVDSLETVQSAPVPTPGEHPAAAEADASRPAPPPVALKKFTLREVALHNHARDCWIAIDNDVYDCTDFAVKHPGGAKILLGVAGKDATKKFDKYHRRYLLEKYKPALRVGVLDEIPLFLASTLSVKTISIHGPQITQGIDGVACYPKLLLIRTSHEEPGLTAHRGRGRSHVPCQWRPASNDVAIIIVTDGDTFRPARLGSWHLKKAMTPQIVLLSLLLTRAATAQPPQQVIAALTSLQSGYQDPITTNMLPPFSPVQARPVSPAVHKMAVTAAALASTILASPAAAAAAAQTVDLNWYPPSSSQINNLTAALDPANAAYGFIFNSSQTPAGVDYSTYNWCNMPHARKTEYVVPPKGQYVLKYVEVVSRLIINYKPGPMILWFHSLVPKAIQTNTSRFSMQMQRHHKRTPYASNSFPVEPYPWNCDDQGLFYYGAPFGESSDGPPPGGPIRPPRPRAAPAPAPGGPYPAGPPGHHHQDPSHQPAAAFWRGTISPINPFTPKGWQGTCQFPQITAGGLDDSFVHGRDLYAVYHDLLNFLPATTKSPRGDVAFRVTNNVITSQVAGMFIGGMFPSLTAQAVPLLIQATGIDSLEPQYSCPTASSLFSSIKSPAKNARWAEHLARAAPLYAQLDPIAGLDPNNDNLGFHASFDHYYDNLSARQCHAKPFPCKAGGQQGTSPAQQCVTQAQADAVYRLGQWEYSHIYRDAGPETLAASAASLGVWIAELASHLRGKMEGTGNGDGLLYLHNFAHDGSTSRLLSVLQIDHMVWPGMGAEIVFELWQKVKTGLWHVRVLFGGKVLRSSNPSLGLMDMLPAETLLAYFDGLVGKNASLVRSKCGA